jgi:predicted metal-dependent hydrolase
MTLTRVYKDIAYRLKKSPRKTTSIYIERDGSVSVLAPEPYDLGKVESLIEKKRSWIYRNLAEWEDLNRTRVQREFVSGEGFLYLGRNYRLQLVESQEQALTLKNGYFCLRKDLAHSGFTVFKQFYRDKGKERLPERVAGSAAQMGLQPGRIRVIELSNRWTSCSANGELNFHWKVMMLPLTILDYVIVHELAHLKYANHTAAFWNLVDKVLPDFQERKAWLRFRGAAMDV